MEFGESIYNCFSASLLYNNTFTIVLTIFLGIAIFNIVAAIQNKKNKKLCFWQLALGISGIWGAIYSILKNESYIDLEAVNKIIFGVIPIIFAIINILRIRKNKPKVVQIISYIGIIAISVILLVKEYKFIYIILGIIMLVMQFIYTRNQEKVIETKARKINNIIIYYIIQTIILVGIFILVIESLLMTKINSIKHENDIEILCNRIKSMEYSNIEELYIPVEEDNKYGFINENGQEKIKCEYDRVSFFSEVKIDNNKYYIALAKKNNEIYIISKGNEKIEITGILKHILKKGEEYLEKDFLNYFYENEYINGGKVTSFTILKCGLFGEENNIKGQMLETQYGSNDIKIDKTTSPYYCYPGRYEMKILLISEDEDNAKYNVTITKNTGETETTILNLPNIDDYGYYYTMDRFSNGYIEIESEDSNYIGWIDENGNKHMLENKFYILDIKDEKVFLQIKENISINNLTYPTVIVKDLNENKIMEAQNLYIYNNTYLIKNNNKMNLLNRNFEKITKDYDKIITNTEVDAWG